MNLFANKRLSGTHQEYAGEDNFLAQKNGRKGQDDSDIDPMVSQRLPARAGSDHAMHPFMRRRAVKDDDRLRRHHLR